MLRPNPTVCVVIPAFNAQEFIQETLSCLSVQSRKPDQIIVVDDGSTDDTAHIVSQWARSARIQLNLQQVPNQGVGNARNTGIKLAATDLICFLDADDLWMPFKLERQLKLWRTEASCSPVGTWYRSFTQSGQLGRIVRPSWTRSYIRRWACFARRGPLLTSTLLITKDQLLELEGFRSDLGTLADLDFALRLCELYDVRVVREPLVRYRTHPGQMHRNWNTTLEDLNKFVPTSYSILGNSDFSDWEETAQLAHEWNIRKKLSWRGKGDSAHQRLLLSGFSLRLEYLSRRLRVELNTR